MVKHIVFWTMKDSANETSKENNLFEMKRRLESMAGKIPGMLKLEVGIDFGRSEASADIVLYSEFVDRAALETYQTHPVHEEVKKYIRSVRDQRSVVDYEI